MRVDLHDLGKVVLHTNHQAITTNINTLVINQINEQAIKTALIAREKNKTLSDFPGATGASSLLRLLQINDKKAITQLRNSLT